MEKIKTDLNTFYKGELEKYGVTAKSVNWRDENAQIIRYEQLIKIFEHQNSSFTINDVGCGYGNLIAFLHKKEFKNFEYKGYDVSPDMIEYANKEFGQLNDTHYHLINSTIEIDESDYSVASGIFGRKNELKESEWLIYILETLDILNIKSRKGFAFNMLTKYSDSDKMRSDLYYSDPLFFFDYCKRNFSRNIALLHDYNEYDFTILVRKEI